MVRLRLHLDCRPHRGPTDDGHDDGGRGSSNTMGKYGATGSGNLGGGGGGDIDCGGYEQWTMDDG